MCSKRVVTSQEVAEKECPLANVTDSAPEEIFQSQAVEKTKKNVTPFSNSGSTVPHHNSNLNPLSVCPLPTLSHHLKTQT